jgi:hypothetical protein
VKRRYRRGAWHERAKSVSAMVFWVSGPKRGSLALLSLAIENVYRDIHFAAQDGQPFEYQSKVEAWPWRAQSPA